MDTVTILLSTYNGASYIEEQIESLLAQQEVKVRICVRDDGSTDNTRTILEKYSAICDLRILEGENIGWRDSFMRLVYDSQDSEYYAFCDQDDVWLPSKIKVAIEKLKCMPLGEPNLYCSNLRYYKDGNDLGLIKKKEPILTLESALMRSIAAGCTMVFNKELRDVIKLYRPDKVTAHDFWTYQVASLLGNVFYDMNSYILYRQHENNQIGASLSWCSIWEKRYKSARENFFNSDRQFAAKELLRLYGEIVCPEKKNKVEKVAYYDSSIINRLNLFFDRSYTMGSVANNFWLRIKILFGKI